MIDDLNWKPMPWSTTLDIRFSDFDQYGHINAKNYLDYVTAGRWKFHNIHFGQTPDHFVEKGIGFFMTRSEVFYKAPIRANQSTILVNSFVESVKGAKLSVPFEIKSADGKILHAQGHMDLMVIDMKSGRPTDLPEWVIPYISEQGRHSIGD